MTKDDALKIKLALGALESIEWHDGGWGLNPDLIETAITAIKEVLAQPAQEPLQYSFKAYWAEDGRIGVVGCIIRPDGGPHILEEFIEPPQATEKYTYGTPLLDAMTKDHVPPPPAQEPVAYLCRLDEHGLFDIPTPDKACKDCFPVYTTPPQRPWVGLMRGARVEGDTVVIKVQSNNEARLLCSELVNEMEKNT